jgi:hypothetical protein
MKATDIAKPTTHERAKALEEAARVADHYAQCDRDHGFPSDRAEEIAAAIRAYQHPRQRWWRNDRRTGIPNVEELSDE